MSNFTVNRVYSYSSSNIHSYLGMSTVNANELEQTFRDYNITPTGKTDDLEKLNNAMYADYSKQVRNQMDNQNGEKNVPWANLCAQIGISATGDYEKDYTAFTQAINLLSNSAIDGQAMTYFAGLKTEANKVFAENKPTTQQEATQSFADFKKQILF